MFFKSIRLDTSPPRVQLLLKDKAFTQAPTLVTIRAKQANIATVDSQPIQFTARDPCTGTVIVEPSDFPDQIVTEVSKGTPQVYDFTEIKDTVSVQYSPTFGDGSGYDICGPRQYSIFDISDGFEKEVDFAQLVQTQDGQWQIKVETDDPANAKTYNMVLRVDLNDYGLTQRLAF